IERRIQSLAQVRTLYVRDFRGGVATLAVGLRVPMLVDELWSAIATLEQPHFALQRSGGTSLELRIEGEAGAGVAEGLWVTLRLDADLWNARMAYLAQVARADAIAGILNMRGGGDATSLPPTT